MSKFCQYTKTRTRKLADDEQRTAFRKANPFVVEGFQPNRYTNGEWIMMSAHATQEASVKEKERIGRKLERNKQPRLVPEKAFQGAAKFAARIAYGKCMQEYHEGVAVWEKNLYPVGSPEYYGWEEALSKIAQAIITERDQYEAANG